MISYFKFRETHYCDTARTAGGGGRGTGSSPGGNGGGGNGGGGNGGGGNGGGGNGGGGNGGGGTSGSTGGGGRPARVSVFVSPPPETVTVVPPGYEAPVKPERVDVHDPSTEMSFKPFGDILGGVFGEPTQVTGVSTDPFRTINGELAFLQPEQEVIPQEQVIPEEQVIPPSTCPRNCSIIHIPTGIVAVDNRMCSCSTIERYQEDPNYRVEFTTQLPEVPVEEPILVPPGELTWYYVKKPSGICERLNVSQNFVNQMTSQGWIFSLTDICPTTEDIIPPELEPEEESTTDDVIPPGEKPEEPTVTVDDFEPQPTPTGLANFGIAGILFAGVLALPILASLGKWK